jgi:hypothetical protein
MTTKKLTPAQLEVSKGIDIFMFRHGIKSDYQLAKKGEMNTNTAGSIRDSGSLTTNTLLKLGMMVGYDEEEKTNLAIIIRVLRDFGVK